CVEEPWTQCGTARTQEHRPPCYGAPAPSIGQQTTADTANGPNRNDEKGSATVRECLFPARHRCGGEEPRHPRPKGVQFPHVTEVSSGDPEQHGITKHLPDQRRVKGPTRKGERPIAPTDQNQQSCHRG